MGLSVLDFFSEFCIFMPTCACEVSRNGEYCSFALQLYKLQGNLIVELDQKFGAKLSALVRSYDCI
jgi:hypothetical protein